jgi:dTDP-4-amino-4,6-dideoxygalactose transaminase
MLGHNYHMPEIQAAIGIEQLKKLPGFVTKRRHNAKRLTEKLKKARNLQLPTEPEGFKHSWYLYTVRMKTARQEQRDKVVEELMEKEIGAVVTYPNPIHRMPYYSKFAKHRLPVTEKAAKQVLSLPIHPGVTSKQIDFIGETVTSRFICNEKGKY